MNIRLLIVPAAAALAAALLAATSGAQPAQEVEGYEVVHGWPDLPPGEILGQTTGVDVDSKGNVWVFHRAGRAWSEPFPIEPIGRPTVWVFDGNSGRMLKSWGANTFIMPHGLTIDRDDNVWLTDVGLQQVFKFSRDGQLLMTLGEARVPCTSSMHGASEYRSLCRGRELERAGQVRGDQRTEASRQVSSVRVTGAR
jgi:hypothetical protein